METQLELPFVGPLGTGPSKRWQKGAGHSLFFGLRPPGAVATAMRNCGARTAAHLGLAGERAAKNLHLSLNGVLRDVSFDEALVTKALQIGDHVVASSFDLVFDRLLNFGTRPPYRAVLTCTEGVSDLCALYEAIRVQMGMAGLPSPRPDGTPHITLFFCDETLPMQGLASPFRWHVDDFWLIHSHTGQGRHDCPGHWPLND